MSASAQAYDPTTLEANEDLVRCNRWVVTSFSDTIRGRTLEIGAGIGTMSTHVRSHCTEALGV